KFDQARTKLGFCSVRYLLILVLNNSLGIFQGCITVYLSRNFVVVALGCNSFRITQLQVLVNNFFNFVSALFENSYRVKASFYK
ncbi:hypothetical protein, partial [Butyrivibrio proteoclasticus]|uniref:hypothetical protein n=1 Tax=Butyrivibrio proteoclasticus TaxID=43305 RepID=UPI0005584611